MGEKKRKEATVKTWYKVLAVLACVFVAGLMIVSSLGSSWITSLRVIQPGDPATVQVTINDVSGDPIVTSNGELYEQRIAAGKGIFYAKDMVITANQSSQSSLITLPVYSTTNGWSDTFALFSTEHDAISQALVGMKTNEQKVITIPDADMMTETWSAAQLTSQGINMTDIHVGDQLSIAVSNTATLEKNATAAPYSVRVGEVTAKSSDGITINLGYPTISIKVLKIATS